jgi:hypothetical protein
MVHVLRHYSVYIEVLLARCVIHFCTQHGEEGLVPCAEQPPDDMCRESGGLPETTGRSGRTTSLSAARYTRLFMEQLQVDDLLYLISMCKCPLTKWLLHAAVVPTLNRVI